MCASVFVVLNPASGGGRGAALEGRVERALRERKIDYELRATRGPGHAVDLAGRAAEEGVRTVVAVGGDGTVHEVAAGLLAARDGEPEPGGPAPAPRSREGGPSLAVVPVGTGNDFFRMVGTPRRPEPALDVLTAGRVRRFDVGLVRWEGGCRRFVNLLGLGVDVEVLRRRASFARLPGLAQYMSALLSAVVRFRPRPVRIRIDGDEVIEEPVHLAAITVGPSAGGGFLLNPGATPDDGRLDLCFVRALSYPEVAACIPRVVRGTHGTLESVRLRRFRRARIDRPEGTALLDFELDGELSCDPVEWLEVEVEPGVLPVLVPGDESCER